MKVRHRHLLNREPIDARPRLQYHGKHKVTAMVKNLHGYIFNPVELQTYDFYSMYRS
jgi:hypothetical protein